MTWAFPIGGSQKDVAGRGSWTLDQGVDIAAPGGAPLLAVDNGTIVGHGISGFGNDAPILKLDSGGYVYYGHAGPGNRRAGTGWRAVETLPLSLGLRMRSSARRRPSCALRRTGTLARSRASRSKRRPASRGDAG